jgi:hypothetical protein
MNITHAREIASRFALPAPFTVSDFAEKGNINRQTYLVVAGPPREPIEYILQLLNPVIFTQPRRVMEAMILCLEAQKKTATEIRLNGCEEWETIRLVPTRGGEPYLALATGEEIQCWRMMARIGHARSYKSLHQIADPAFRLKIAEQAGRGLALFCALTAGMDPAQISCPLPGYRDTGLYYDQLHSALAGSRTQAEASTYMPEDPVLRKATGSHFLIRISEEEYKRRKNDPDIRGAIELALEQKPFAMKLANGLANGELRRKIVHGDTKLENFLFDINSGNVRALVDMDTIMPHTWLSDWGDMMRSLVNPAGEKETDLTTIQIDLEVFRAAAQGFLSSAYTVAPDEIALMADAIPIMALELGVRFLADYLRGDSYFMPGPLEPPDLNKTRAMVQFRLFEELKKNAGPLNQILGTSKP